MTDPLPQGAVPGFLPSSNAFAFINAFPHEPDIQIGPVKLGDASRGLCGGMAWAVRDLFEAHQPPPADVVPPAAGTALFNTIVDRLVNSFDLPVGPARYLEWMALNDAEVMARTAREWAKARAEIDSGHPSSLALVTVHSLDPLQLGRNHQVLAYAYETASGDGPLSRWIGTTVTVKVYDPNSGPNDDVWLVISGDPAVLHHNINIGEPVRGFFVTPYAPPGT